MREQATKEEKALHLPFFTFEVLSAIVVSYYLLSSVIRIFLWISGGLLGALLGFLVSSGIIALPLTIPFVLNFVARCEKHKVVISSVVDGAKVFNIIFLPLALMIISEFLTITGSPAVVREILYSVGVFCIPWFFVTIRFWEFKNNKRISISIVENQIRLTLRETHKSDAKKPN